MVWQAEPRKHGKWSKPPRDPRTLQKADKTDPKHFGTIYEAQAALRPCDVDGLGFSTTEGDPFFFVDIDGCVDPDTCEITDQRARALVAEFGTYAEISPSRTGIRIIGKGKLHRNHNAIAACGLKIELYDHARFATLIGHHLPATPATIRDCTDRLRAIEDREFPPLPEMTPQPRTNTPVPIGIEALFEMMRRSKPGDRIELLLRGDWQTYGKPSHSEGALALLRHLAEFTGGDAALMDEAFRQTGMYDPADWERNDGRFRTHGARDVAKALDFWRKASGETSSWLSRP
jgi:primase-polymerase (primpol)-like protein